MESLQQLVTSACVCSNYQEGNLTIKDHFRHGLASTISLQCESCCSSTSVALAERHPLAELYDINRRRSVLAMRLIGSRRGGLNNICGILDMPPPVSKSNSGHSDALHTAVETDARDSMKSAAQRLLVRRTTEQHSHPEHVAVSTDGTWMKRGFSSMFGMPTVVSYETEKVLNAEVLSKHCSGCKTWKNRWQARKISNAEYEQWKCFRLCWK